MGFFMAMDFDNIKLLPGKKKQYQNFANSQTFNRRSEVSSVAAHKNSRK